jgi:hypothetical protein
MPLGVSSFALNHCLPSGEKDILHGQLDAMNRVPPAHNGLP